MCLRLNPSNFAPSLPFNFPLWISFKTNDRFCSFAFNVTVSFTPRG